MQERVITLATPIFFLLIFLEFAIGYKRGRNTYRLNDAINSISLGVMSQVVGVFAKLLQFGIYGWLVRRIALFDWPLANPIVWLAALLSYDCCYYWLHRMDHEVNVLWAAHVVHHQSEEYNLSTALRQTGSGALLSWIFYLPMALLGFPLQLFIAVALVDLLYQFWVHTQQIGKLGWFDRVFVSPSNHRVHHGVNDIYVDKNYGGILILWDRLFGTFIEENDAQPVIYGTRNPLRSWNPIRANLEVYQALWLDTWRAQRFVDKLRLWLARPGWRPADVAVQWPSTPFDITRPLFDPTLTRGAQYYCLLQFTVVLLITSHFLAAHQLLDWGSRYCYAFWLCCTLWTIGCLLEGRKRYVLLEVLRLLITAVGVLLTASWFGAPLPIAVQAMIVMACALSCIAVVFFFRTKQSA